MYLLDQELHNMLTSLNTDQQIFLNINNEQFFALKSNNCLHIYLNRCPHQNKQLWSEANIQWDETFTLFECQYHGAQFLTTNGQCVQGPCLDKALTQFEIVSINGAFYLVQSDLKKG